MKEYKKVVVPQREINELVGVTCDFCGAKGKHSWQSSTYEIKETEIEVTVRHKEGSNYPEGGSGEEFKVDMCPRCFKEKLAPFLQSIALPGRKLEYEDWDL